jgi:hypothetical protein
MPVMGSCHCGAVRIEVPRAPEWIGRCNCSFCRRIGSLMAYYPDDGGVRITGETVPYIWGDKMISLHHCPVCGCFTDWRPLTACESSRTRSGIGKVGVNARLLDGFEVRDGRPLFDGREIEVRFLDNAGDSDRR